MGGYERYLSAAHFQLNREGVLNRRCQEFTEAGAGREGIIRSVRSCDGWLRVCWDDGSEEVANPARLCLLDLQVSSARAREIVSVLREAHQFCPECSRVLCRSMEERFPEHDWIALLEAAEGEPR
jgi:hypothetical protein